MIKMCYFYADLVLKCEKSAYYLAYFVEVIGKAAIAVEESIVGTFQFGFLQHSVRKFNRMTSYFWYYWVALYLFMTVALKLANASPLNS